MAHIQPGREQKLIFAFTDPLDDEQPNDNDSRNSASETDIAAWHSSAAEFDNIDDDIAKEYENVDPWGEDFPVLSPATGPATAAAPVPAPGSNNQVAAALVYGQPVQPAWNFAQADLQYTPSLLGSLATPNTGVSTPPTFSNNAASTAQAPHQQSWEIIDNPQPSQSSQLYQPLQPFQPPQSFEWPTVGGYLGSMLPGRNSGGEDASGDALRFIPVNPLQPQPLARGQRRGPFQDRERQEETSRTRGLKACVRCRMQKIRVSKWTLWHDGVANRSTVFHC
jgi:hypothetical protein